jgi:hypothetical protein
MIRSNEQLEVIKNKSQNFGISYILALRKPATSAGDIVLFEQQREQSLQMVELPEEQ